MSNSQISIHDAIHFAIETKSFDSKLFCTTDLIVTTDDESIFTIKLFSDNPLMINGELLVACRAAVADLDAGGALSALTIDMLRAAAGA